MRKFFLLSGFLLLLAGGISAQTLDIYLYLDRAEQYAAQNDSEKALENYQAVLGIDPDNVKALNGAGVIYQQRGDYRKAKAMFQKAYDLNTSNGESQHNLIYINNLLQKYGITDVPDNDYDAAANYLAGSEYEKVDKLYGSGARANGAANSGAPPSSPAQALPNPAPASRSRTVSDSTPAPYTASVTVSKPSNIPAAPSVTISSPSDNPAASYGAVSGTAGGPAAPSSVIVSSPAPTLSGASSVSVVEIRKPVVPAPSISVNSQSTYTPVVRPRAASNPPPAQGLKPAAVGAEKSLRLAPEANYQLTYDVYGNLYYVSNEQNSGALTESLAAIHAAPGNAASPADLRDYYQRVASDYSLIIAKNPQRAVAFNNRGVAYVYLGDYNRALADFEEAVRLDPFYFEAGANREQVKALIASLKQRR